jgi:hypothetical protein
VLPSEDLAAHERFTQNSPDIKLNFERAGRFEVQSLLASQPSRSCRKQSAHPGIIDLGIIE